MHEAIDIDEQLVALAQHLRVHYGPDLHLVAPPIGCVDVDLYDGRVGSGKSRAPPMRAPHRVQLFGKQRMCAFVRGIRHLLHVSQACPHCRCI